MSRGKSIGFLEVLGYSVALYSMDKACKNADIKILGIDTINPKDVDVHIPLCVQVKFEGKIDQVEYALNVAKESAMEFCDEKHILISKINSVDSEVKKICKISKV